MRRLLALGLLTLVSGCTATGEMTSFLPNLFRSEPARLERITPGPDQLAGSDSRQVSQILGTPDLVRRDGPAEIWHYAGDSCRLLVFLYDDASASEAPAADRPKTDRKAERASLTKAAATGFPNATNGTGIVRHVAVWPAAADTAPCLASVARRAHSPTG
jgi:hypothetical protein